MVDPIGIEPPTRLRPGSSVRGARAGQTKTLHVLAPDLERLLSLSREFVALVDGGHSGDGPGLVVEDLIGDMWCDAEPGHP